MSGYALNINVFIMSVCRMSKCVCFPLCPSLSLLSACASLQASQLEQICTSKSVSANKRVCPTASSPKVQTFEPLLVKCKTIGFCLPHMFFFCGHTCCGVLHEIFWFMTGLSKKKLGKYLFASQHSEQNTKAEITKKHEVPAI